MVIGVIGAIGIGEKIITEALKGRGAVFRRERDGINIGLGRVEIKQV